MKNTKKRALYILAALFAALFVLSCLVGFAACGGGSDDDCADGHTLTSWTTTKEATCTETGSQTSTCDVCGETVTETIPATGHKFGEQTNDATCTTEGEIYQICSVCQYKYVISTSAALGHKLTGTYDSGTTSWTYACSQCSETIDLANDPVASLTLEATDETSFEAAGLWGEASFTDVTPVIDVVTTDENNGTVSISTSNNHIGGGDTPMDKDVVLHANIKMGTDKVLIVRCACTLDLNGYSISLGESCTSDFGVIQVGATNVYGDLTVIDSSVGVTGKISGTNGVTVRGDANNDGHISTFTLVSGSVEGSNIAVSTNGSDEWGCEVINIQDGTVSCTGEAGVGIYMPNGILNVTGGTISGATGIEIKSGTATISGAAISTTATGDPSVSTNGKGTDSYGYAIAIISTNTSYHDLVSVTIGGGCTIEGTIYSDVTSGSTAVVTVDETLGLTKDAYDSSGNKISDETVGGSDVDHYIYTSNT